MPSGIAYCDETWNVVTGCTPDFPCWERCWARGMCQRFPKAFGGDFTPRFHPERLNQPLHWREPRVILVAAMGDLFNDAIGDDCIFQVCGAIRQAPRHRYLFLTKRWQRMARMVLPMLHHLGANGDPVWWGFTAWDNDSARTVVNIVRDRFFQSDQVWLSLEPLLGPVNLGDDLGLFNQVIAGCESGPGARHTPCAWFRDVQSQCREAGVPCYVKQASGEAGEPKVIHFEPEPGDLPWTLRKGAR